MDERTPEEIAKIFLAASSSVNLINTKTAKGTDQTEEEWKDCIKQHQSGQLKILQKLMLP
jgi:ABC-type nitrate/sulfonate/bicarbonate transport system permease component